LQLGMVVGLFMLKLCSFYGMIDLPRVRVKMR